jgi:hypothetical protein
MRYDSFDKALKLLSGSVRVEHIMTPEEDLDCSSLVSDISNARELSNKTGYDVIPIRNDGKISSYYERKSDDILEIKLRNVISSGSAVSNCFRLFHDGKFFFVNSENSVVGFVNHADLDKPPVRLLFYVLLCKLEYVLMKLITRAHKNDSWTDLLSHERREKIRQVLDARKKQGLEVDLANCLNLSDIFAIVLNSIDLLKVLDFASRSQCEKAFGGLVQLRNDVMHATSPTLLAEGSEKLLERLEKLEEMTQRSEKALAEAADPLT